MTAGPHIVLLGAVLALAACAGTPAGSPALPSAGSPGAGNPSPGGAPPAVPGTGGASSSTGTGTDASASAGEGVDGTRARTAGERRGDLDARLDASLGGFDERLRKEQQQTAQQRDAGVTGATPDTAGYRDGGDDEPGGGRDRSGDLRSESAGASGNRGDGGGSAALGGNGQGAQAVLSGQDDDIIARRLRKAAEDETDPELKEKLWKEYRDYKENTRGGK